MVIITAINKVKSKATHNKESYKGGSNDSCRRFNWIFRSEICRRITGQGKTLGGLVRETSNLDRVSALKGWGVETMLGDMRATAFLTKACQGVEIVITTATRSMKQGDSIPVTDQQGQTDMVKTASKRGSNHFIYISYSKNIDAGMAPCPLTLAKRAVEQAVIDSGLTNTLLSPSYFMEVWLSLAVECDYSNTIATIYREGNAKVSYISLGDVAQKYPELNLSVFRAGVPEGGTWINTLLPQIRNIAQPEL